MTASFIELLPYKPSIRIFEPKLRNRVLSLTKSLLEEVAESLNDFYVYEDLCQFDPHVGENLCQIRACQLLEIYEKELRPYKLVNFKFYAEKRKVKLAIRKVNELISGEYEADFLAAGGTLLEYLEKNQLNILLSKSTFFLTLSHFLSKHKTVDSNENMTIDYISLIDALQISKNLARRFVHVYQKKLSYASYNYVSYEAASKARVNISNEVMNLLQYNDEDGRYTLPCYIVMKILLGRLLQLKPNILIILRFENKPNALLPMLYSYDKHAKHYVYSSSDDKKLMKRQCIVFHGVSGAPFIDLDSYVSRFNELGLFNIIMANMAGHPQYSGRKLSGLKYNPFAPLVASDHRGIANEALSLERAMRLNKNIAESIGCLESNNYLFFIRHIFADITESQLNKINKNIFYSDIKSWKINPNISYNVA